MARDRKWAQRTAGFSTQENATALEQLVDDLDGFNTPKIAVESILEKEKLYKNVWEPAAGLHYIAKELDVAGHNVFTSDIHRWHKDTECQRSFMDFTQSPYGDDYDVFTNPPFKQAFNFAMHGLRILNKDATVALLLRVQFLEGIKRKLELFDNFRPYKLYVYSYRLPRMSRFFYTGKISTSTLSFGWFVWKVGYYKSTTVEWL